MIARYGLLRAINETKRITQNGANTQASFQLDESPVEYALS